MENNGFTPDEIKQMETSLGKIVDGKLKPIQEWQEQKTKDDLENQNAVNDLLIKMKEFNSGKPGADLPFEQLISHKMATEFESRKSEFENFQHDRTARLKVELKTVGDMALSNISGGGATSFSNQPAILPSQLINARDLVPAVFSPTGDYTYWRETGTEGSISHQTEGSEKSQIDYDFTKVNKVEKYIAGFARFSKQLMTNLGWLQNTLPRLLQRDFYKKENDYFWDVMVTQATGFNTTSETHDAKALVDLLMGRLSENFNNSYILVHHMEVGRILKLLFDGGNYYGAGSIVGALDGSVRIAGTPVVGVSWAKSQDMAIAIDRDYVERIYTTPLSIEFSYEDYKNFTENKVTARIECQEEFNILLTDAVSKMDMGNSSSS
jgi:hypothetical protein